jgi:acyl-CoA thioesterase-1
MYRWVGCLTTVLAVLCAAALWAEQKAADVDAEGFRPLFNGTDLAGWKADEEVRKHWGVEDGVIKYDGKNKDLWTEASFKDFILKVEWRLPKPGDSGIYLRGSSKSQVNIWCNDLGSGEVYGYRTDKNQPEEVRQAVTPKKRADKPVGEWNAFVITMKGDRLTVVLNGEEVISNAQLPGASPEGPIALQHHGGLIEFRNILIQDLKKPAQDLPRVLLIGDSISMGYTQPVRELLKGKANVHRPPTNCASTLVGLKSLEAWLGDEKWDVIHFNWGLHDLKYIGEKGNLVAVDKGKQQVPLDEYEKNLRQLVQQLKKTGAKLIWCATTPVPEGAEGRVPGDEVKYNEAAAKVMKDNAVEISDLHAFAASKLKDIQRPKNVHFTAEGSRQLAEFVAAKIEKALAK